MHIDIVPSLTWLGGVAFLLICAYMMHRQGLDAVSKRATETWQQLAQAQKEQIQQLRDSLERLETDYKAVLHENSSLREQNAQLVTLNLALQTTNQQNAQRMGELSEQIRHLNSGVIK